MTLHEPSLKLAGLYLAVLMAISLFFSANIYQLSMQELERGLRAPIHGAPGTVTRPLILWIQSERLKLYEEAKDRVLARLVFVNVIILGGGGVLCYYLARRTLQPIEEAHEAQSRFTADASHELRTPIAAMQTEIEVALMNPTLTLAQAKDQLRSNLEELTRLTALSDGLLKLARLEKSELVPEKVELSGVVRTAVKRVMPLAQAKQVHLAAPEHTSLTVMGDRPGLVEVLFILLDNAIKYSPAGSMVDIGVREGRRQAFMSVTDHGAGIHPGDLPHVFKRFYRADAARSKGVAQSGYGLGLAIAKNIVEAHGGEITVASHPGKATTFTVSLPR